MREPPAENPAILLRCPEAEPLPASVASVLDSRAFEKAPTLRGLLVYLWAHRGEPISEYAIATEALGRNAHFSPKTDATARVQISRLRQRLERFYKEEGVHCAERLIIPLGTHHVRIEVAHSQPMDSALEPAETTGKPGRKNNSPLILGVCCVVLLMACTGLATSLYRGRAAQPQAIPPRPAFWKTFFGNGRSTRLILPTPVFFNWVPPGRPKRATLMVRDTDVNEFTPHPPSEPLRSLARTFGPPHLAQSYTVTSDTFASIRLARYLDRLGLDSSVYSGASAPLEALDRENAIALGTWGTLAPLKPYLDRLSFVLESHESFVVNQSPQPGEPKRFDQIDESESRGIWPGVIALLPGRGGQTHLLILASRHTSALVSFLTSSNGLDQLDRIWKAKGSPEFYELVVSAEMNDESLVRIWPLALHSLNIR